MQLREGSATIAVRPGSKVTIRADGLFTAYACLSDKRKQVLGPLSTEARFLRTYVPKDCDQLEVVCENRTCWNMDEMEVISGEYPDPEPLEIPLGMEEPESLEDSMKRFIREEIGRGFAAAKNAGSFEEEDDFAIPEDDEEGIFSPYELHEMQEEEPVDREKAEGASPALTEERGGQTPEASPEVVDAGRAEPRSEDPALPPEGGTG